MDTIDFYCAVHIQEWQRFKGQWEWAITAQSAGHDRTHCMFYFQDSRVTQMEVPHWCTHRSIRQSSVSVRRVTSVCLTSDNVSYVTRSTLTILPSSVWRWTPWNSSLSLDPPTVTSRFALSLCYVRVYVD